MIRSGKSSNTPWLLLPPEQFGPWASLSGIELNDVHVGIPSVRVESSLDGKDEQQTLLESKGAGMMATVDLGPELSQPLMIVPEKLVLSKQRVHEIATGDAKLLELLNTCGDFALSPRIAIMIFLLHQATIANPDCPKGFGRSTEFIGYLKLLPIPPVPTMYSEMELSAFAGTTLIPAVGAKLRKLRLEFKTLRRLTKPLTWVSEVWWGASRPTYGFTLLDEEEEEEEEEENNDGFVKFSDWLTLDAMYRSRALEWLGQGEAIVPGIDMANHEVPANSLYDAHDGLGLLVLKEEISLKAGDEIFISYGDEKSAMEMLFSYGFIARSMKDAQSVLISLPSPGDDPLGFAKVAVASRENCVPGIHIHHDQQVVIWDSEVLWLMIVNQEDGLDFKVIHSDDEESQIFISWKDQVVKLRDLKGILEKEKMWDVFQLRAAIIVSTQVENQLEKMATAEIIDGVDTKILQYAKRLSSLERNILQEARQVLDLQKQVLLDSEAVKSYFRLLNESLDYGESYEDEDFS